MNGWIGFDLDGTLAVYDRWDGGKVGEPVESMTRQAREFLAQGIEVRVVTARVHPSNEDHEGQRVLIEAWCEEHLGQRVVVTCSKDYGMWCLFDDRAVAVERNTGRILGGNWR